MFSKKKNTLVLRLLPRIKTCHMAFCRDAVTISEVSIYKFHSLCNLIVCLAQSQNLHRPFPLALFVHFLPQKSRKCFQQDTLGCDVIHHLPRRTNLEGSSPSLFDYHLQRRWLMAEENQPASVYHFLKGKKLSSRSDAYDYVLQICIVSPHY